MHRCFHYCDNGLVPNLRHDKNGNRIFDEESINWLTCTKFLRDSGLSISEIKHYFELCQIGESTFAERYEILKSLEKKTALELIEAQNRYHCLEVKIKHCQDIQNGKCEDDCNPLNW